MRLRHPYRREQSGPDPVIIIALAVGLLLVLPCTLVVLLTGRLPRRLTEQRAFWPLVAIVGTGCIAGTLLVAYPFRVVYDQVVQVLAEVVREARTDSWSVQALWIGLRPIWFESLLFAPGVAFLRHLFTPQSAEQRLLAQRRQQSNALQKACKRVRRRMARKQFPDQVREQVVLGLPVQGDLREWVRSGLFTLPTHEISKHGVVIGASGTGKSETLLRLPLRAAQVLGWQVIYIDGKGDQEAGWRFVAAMKSAGVQNVKMFPGEPYNGWVGDEEALLSRFLAVEEFSDTHYRAIAENLLRLALSAPSHRVTNSAELLSRLNLTNEVLLGLYAGNPDLEAYLTHYGKRDPLGVYNRYAALLAKLRGKLDGAWSYDTVDAAYICLDGLALPGIISGLGRYFTQDFAHYAGLRKPKERHVLFIFDELGAVDVDLSNMYERVRSCGVSVFVAGQSDHSISYRGLVQNAERILSTATTIILHANNNPDRIIGRAGTLYTVEEVSDVEGDEASGRGSMRLAKTPKIDANVIRQLTTGEAYVIAHGKAHLVRVMPVHNADTALADAEAYVRQQLPAPPVQPVPVAPLPTPVPVSSEPAAPAQETAKAPPASISPEEKDAGREADDDILT
jgi:hypothetical protein